MLDGEKPEVEDGAELGKESEVGGNGNFPPSSLGVFMNRPEPKSVTMLMGELLVRAKTVEDTMGIRAGI